MGDLSIPPRAKPREIMHIGPFNIHICILHAFEGSSLIFSSSVTFWSLILLNLSSSVTLAKTLVFAAETKPPRIRVNHMCYPMPLKLEIICEICIHLRRNPFLYRERADRHDSLRSCLVRLVGWLVGQSIWNITFFPPP